MLVVTERSLVDSSCFLRGCDVFWLVGWWCVCLMWCGWSMQNFDEVVDVMPRIERCAAFLIFWWSTVASRSLLWEFCYKVGCGATTWRGLENGSKEILQSILLLLTNAAWKRFPITDFIFVVRKSQASDWKTLIYSCVSWNILRWNLLLS